MEDERIIDLYWQRSQEAISRTDEKYGRLCTKISLNILSNAQDAEECVSDTYMALWNSIPPTAANVFSGFCGSHCQKSQPDEVAGAVRPETRRR